MKSLKNPILSTLCIALTLSATTAHAGTGYLVGQKLLNNGQYRALGVSLDKAENPDLYRYKFLDCQIPAPITHAENGSLVGVTCKAIGKPEGYTQTELQNRREEISADELKDFKISAAVGAGVGVLV